MRGKEGLRSFVFFALLSVGLGLTGCTLFGGLTPEPPSWVLATVDEYPDRIRITWAESPEATVYELWRSQYGDGEYSQLTRTEDTLYEDLTTVPGEMFWYKVRACNRFGCGEFTQPVSGRAQVPPGAPGVPPNLHASQGTYVDHVRLEWDPVSDAETFEIYRSDAQGGSFQLYETTVDNSYDDYNVSPGEAYWYKVRACNASGCGELSGAVMGFAGLPSPEWISATDGKYLDKVEVSWAEVSGADFYALYRGDSREGPLDKLADVTETSYVDRDVAPGVRYWYKVKACNYLVCSDLSEAEEGMAGSEGPPLPPPSPS